MSPDKVAVLAARPRVAGPFATEPSATLNLLPWHGQLMVPFETVVTEHPMCGHVVSNALNEPAAGWVMTTLLSS